MPFGTTHTSLRALASYATQSFFSRILVEGAEEVPQEGEPIIACANHWNSAVDPAVLSCFFPYNRKLHYWAKSTLFKPGFPRSILLDAGNIPVDRTTKDNQKLFASTFDMLKYGEAIAIFPEGGSYTNPGMTTFKEGAAWAALEYAKNIRAPNPASLSTGGVSPKPPKDVTICVAGITYTDKTKYRSSIVMQFGKSITVGPYVEEFTVDPKAAVKRLIKDIEEAMRKLTVNAPDWESLNAATTARKMLWVEESTLPLTNLRDIEQTLVDFFAKAFTSPSIARLRTLLLTYRSSLYSTRLTHYTLSGVPLPSTLDPAIPYPLPTRFRVLFSLLLSTLGSLIRLPFFILPLVVHLPIYLIAKYSLTFSDLEEDLAQNKIALGLVLATVLYPTIFGTAWVLMFFTPVGGVMAFGFTWLFAVYHNSLVTDNYNAAKRLLASWRVLVGIWAPHAKSETLSSLGITEKREGENEVRRVLRLRLEACRLLEEMLKSPEGSEVREKLKKWGGKMPGVGVVASPKEGKTI